MNIDEARAWLNGERSTTNYMPQDPFETWAVRIAQADAAMIQQAYWVLKARDDGLLKSNSVIDMRQRAGQKGLESMNLSQEDNWAANDRADLEREFREPERIRCSDGLCGALDCARCYPSDGCREEQDDGNTKGGVEREMSRTWEKRTAERNEDTVEPCIQDGFPSVDEIMRAGREQLRVWYRELPVHLCYGGAQRLVMIAKQLVNISNAEHHARRKICAGIQPGEFVPGAMEKHWDENTADDGVYPWPASPLHNRGKDEHGN